MVDSNYFRQSALPLLWVGYIERRPWKLKVNVMGMVTDQAHIVSPVSKRFAYFSVRINQNSNSLRSSISQFDLEESKVKVMGNVKGQSHIHVADKVSNPYTSFSFKISRNKHF